MNRHLSWPMLAMLGVLSPGAGSSPARAEFADPQIGTAVYISSEDPVHRIENPTEIREGSWDLLIHALEARYGSVIPRSVMESYIRDWRVRTDMSIGDGFVSSIRFDLQATRVLLATFSIYPDRLILTARLIDTDLGDVVWVHIVEEPLSFTPGSESARGGPIWQKPAAIASARLVEAMDDRGPAAYAPELLVLPVSARGLPGSVADLATHCLLRSIVATGSWRARDPGLLVTTMRGLGIDPDQPARRIGPDLAESGCDGCAILQADATSYDIDAQIFRALPEGAESLFNQASVPELELSLRIIDARTGLILAAGQELLERPERVGLFGVVRSVSPTAHLQQATDRMIGELTKVMKDS